MSDTGDATAAVRSNALIVHEKPGNHGFHVPLEAGGTGVMATIDTGAEHIVLPESVYKIMVPDHERHEKRSTVIESVSNESIPAYMVTLPLIRVGPLELHDVPVLVMRKNGFCVLGRSALRHLKLTIEGSIAELAQ